MNDMVSVEFTYADESGATTTMHKTVQSEYLGGGELDVLGDLFKDFLISAGFINLAYKRIEWVEDDR